MSSTATQIGASIPVTSEYLHDSDGKPMAETDLHRKLMQELLHALEEHFRLDTNVYVSGNIFLYFLDEEKQRQSVSPDIMVVRGVEKKQRRIYKMDSEGKAPDVVIELTSSCTKLEDLGTKRVIYAYLGVKEYFLFDPYGEHLEPPLRGYRLEGNEYMPMVGSRLVSQVLGLEIRMEDNWLRLYKRGTDERLRTPAEAEAERSSAEVKALEAEAEIARLREELAKLRKV